MTQKNNYNPLSRLGIDNAGEDLSGIAAGQVPVRLEDGTWNGIEPGTISDADMLKAVYDINDNGLVDKAEDSNNLGGQLPAHYHNVDNSVESLTRVFVTPVEKTAIIHTNREALDDVSGINTGDQDLSPYMVITDYDSDENGTVDDSEKLGGELPTYYGKSSILDGNGIISGIVISINTNTTKIDISSGSYHISQNGDKTFDGITGLILSNLLTSIITYLAINPSNNSIIQKTTPFTMPERRQYIIIGAAIHSNKTIINAINNLPDVAILGLAQFNDLFDGLGNFNRYGNIISPNGTNLFINKSAGQLVKRGVNYVNDVNNPHVITLDALVAPNNIRYRLSDSTEYADTNTIDVNNYESSSGVRSAVPTNKYTIQRITIFPSNLIRIQYGQDTYQSQALALQAINTEIFIEEQNISLNGLTRAYLVVKQGTTDLTNTDNAIFVELDKFGQTTLGSGIGTTTLQQAYNNSATPEILTNSTLGAFSLKRDSSADTDNVFEIVNGAGDVVFIIDGNGKITALSDLVIDTGTEKTLLLNEIVWDDLNFSPLVGGGAAATRPDDVTINNVFYKEFTSSNNQTCGDQKEFPHNTCIDKGLSCYPHLHCFLKNGESAGTTGVQFTVYWEVRENGNIIRNGSVVLSGTSTQLTSNTAKLNLNDTIGFAAPNTIGGQLALRIARTGGNAGDVIVMSYGIHYPIDTIGSRTLDTK